MAASRMGGALWRLNLRESVAVLVLLVASIVYRLPALLNAAGTNSDAAIVGLQAMHLRHGEWSWFLWGSGYQTSADAVMAAGLFTLLGPTPFALMLSALLGHIALTFFAYATLRRRLETLPAALLTALLVLTPGPVHAYVLYPPRQCSLTLFFAGIWWLDGAPGSRRPKLRIALGGFVAALACFADPFALLFLPALALFVVLTACEAEPAQRVKQTAAGLGGAFAGVVPFWLLWRSADATHGVYTLNSEFLPRNWKLLTESCLPFILSIKVFFTETVGNYQTFKPPGWFRAVELVGAAVLVLGTLVGAQAIGLKRLKWTFRRLGAFGAAMFPVTLGAFLVAAMATDFYSTRYLAPIVLFAPFALAPFGRLVGTRWLGIALAPYLVSAGVAGWVHYGGDVSGLRIRRDAGRALDEDELASALRVRGVRYGFSDYWVAYRLTFLFREDLVIVPNHDHEQRYKPYEAAMRAAPLVAYVFDPWRSREDLAWHAAEIRNGKTDFDRTYEELHAGRYTVLLLRRSKGRPASSRSLATL